jgi:hypothetical protein
VSELNVLELLGGFFGLVVMALMLRVVLATWMKHEQAGIASLAFSIGLAFATIATSLFTFGGAIVGSAFVGWLFFRREVATDHLPRTRRLR